MNPDGLRIIYVGALWEGSTALQRMRSLADIGAIIIPVDTHTDAVRRREKMFFERVLRKLLGPRDLAGANEAIVQAAERNSVDVLWIDKGLTIHPETLQAVRERRPYCRIVGYSPDDMMNPNNQSRRFLEGLPLHDVYFTTKSYGVKELKGLGCRRAYFVGNAYDPYTHRPLLLTDEQRASLGGLVGFIGQWEPERSESICRLAESGVQIRVWGGDWEHCACRAPSLKLENRPLWGQDYARALCAFDINLCFLRKCNRDLQTTRSMEIPACGAFMLAERTDEHLALFEEGKEAEFFANDAELLEKTRYYLAHPAERLAIAEAGRQRCLRSGYSNHDRMRQMLSLVNEEGKELPSSPRVLR